MSVDAARASFLAESRELIADMELALLDCERGDAGPDKINAIFRAAHTIKGNAGLFGFDRVVAFTHVVESALDQIRSGKTEINAEWAALLIECRDHMSALIDAIADGGDGNDPQLTVWGKELTGRLAAIGALALPGGESHDSGDLLQAAAESLTHLLDVLTHHHVDVGSDVEVARQLLSKIAAMSAPKVPAAKKFADGPKVESGAWHVSLRVQPDVLRYGLDPMGFVRYLATIGRIESAVLVTDSLPAPDQFDPETHYVGYEIRIADCPNEEEIEAAFQFIREYRQLTILPPQAPLAAYAQLLAELPEGRERAGELLLQSGSLTPSELAAVNAQLASSPQDVKRSSEPSRAEAPAGEHARAAAGEQHSIRVDAEKLEGLIDLVGELVIAGAATNLMAQRANLSELSESSLRMARLVEEVRDQTLKLRMMQMAGTFGRFSRVVRDVAKELGKDIRLETHGGETELDKTLIERITDPLTHLVRNAIDHGIEPAQTRLANGKSAQGVVTLNAYHDSGSVVIEVSDDGGGLKREKILRKARERGLVGAEQVLTDREVYGLIFEPGFSTAEAVTNLSGRGVGMDVVKRNVMQLRGTVEIDSQEGSGTRVRIRLPLTLAIIEGFLVKAGGSSFVIPLEMVEECVESSQAEGMLDQGHRYLDLRGDVLPYVRLREHFNLKSKAARRESIVVVRCGAERAGFVVDELLGEHQTVIKPLSRVLNGVRGLSGSTILADGAIALIIDAPQLIDQCKYGGALARTSTRSMRNSPGAISGAAAS